MQLMPLGNINRRHAIRLLGLAYMSVSLAACSALPEKTDLEVQTTLTDVSVDQQNMLSLLNSYRRANNLPTLEPDPRLVNVSQEMARHIAQRDSMDTWQHSAFGLSQRLDKNGYQNYAGAENLGAGYADLPAAFKGWQGSAGHNKNLLNPYVTRVGIARTNRNTGKWRNFWVMTLARPAEDGRPDSIRQ